MIFFYFLKIIFDINISKQFKIYLILVKYIKFFKNIICNAFTNFFFFFYSDEGTWVLAN